MWILGEVHKVTKRRANLGKEKEQRANMKEQKGIGGQSN